MPVYFASDVHIRLDRPERGRRLARWVATLRPDDRLYIVGDLCDFWFGSRQRRGDPLADEGLHALAEFRSRGGDLFVLAGNHDLWLGPYYEKTLGARWLPEPQTVEAYGLKLLVTHGHRAGGREPWKAGMESRAFLQAFQALPAPIANQLDRGLDVRNEKGRIEDEARLFAIYRKSLAAVDPAIDVAVFGHVHAPLDDPTVRPRLVVLGGWHGRTSYLRVDEQGATHVVEPAEGGDEDPPSRLDETGPGR